MQKCTEYESGKTSEIDFFGEKIIECLAKNECPNRIKGTFIEWDYSLCITNGKITSENSLENSLIQENF